MKANELMIGDWVQIIEPCKYTGAIGRVKTLIDHKDDENAYFKVFLKNNTIHIGVEDICSDDIRPIPLTLEILKKNGFVKGYMFNNVWNYIEDYKRLVIVYTGEVFNIQDTLIEFKHVHKLQHILKICGIEKEIEL